MSEFVALLHALRLRRDDETGKPVVVKIFEWEGAESSREAHAHPVVATIRRRMEAHVGDRGVRPKWRFRTNTQLDPSA